MRKRGVSSLRFQYVDFYHHSGKRDEQTDCITLTQLAIMSMYQDVHLRPVDVTPFPRRIFLSGPN